ncbi:hypothetical protein CCR75_002421 [Bremia lactucae]|uniref:Uncharacterized protein n=1 Tax=Bremia lactucae TaxID=4779 RepID=A0A976ID36_BRELC|nr:hypothetical protein CCR75_002421 [Bremia lactucae]
MTSSPSPETDKMHTPVAESARYNDQTVLNFDSSASEKLKDEGCSSVFTDRHGHPLVKFFKWYVTRKQRIFLISGLVIIVFVVILLIIFLAILPALIKHNVDSVQLAINYLDVKSIPNATSLSVDLSVNVQHDIGISASTDDITAWLLYGGVAFGSVIIPGLDIKTGKQDYNVTVDGTLMLTDVGAFNSMAATLLDDTETLLGTTATITAHALGMTFNDLTLRRTLHLKGFNMLRDPAPVVNYINWFGCSNDVYQMDINVTLTNPSVMGLNGIGALNLSLYYGNSYLGYAESMKPDLGLPRGESVQILRATVPQDTKALSSMALGVAGGSAHFYITGDNPYSIKYTQFEDAIGHVNMSIIYTDGLAKLGFNTSCDKLSHLA